MQRMRSRFIFSFAVVGLSGFSFISFAQTPFTLKAADIGYDASTSRVVARGTDAEPVKVSGADGDVTAQTITYDATSNKLIAEGDVLFTDPSGTALTIDKLEMTGDLKQGTLNELRLRLPQLGEVGQAASASISGSIYTMEEITYSPCQGCEGKAKPWEIHAGKATFNQPEGTMTYRDATLNVYGVPVAYVPWFRHALGTEKPMSGLLPPSFGRSEDLGEQLGVGGYIYSPNENADYTLQTRLMSKRGAMLMAERRQKGTRLNTDVELSALRDHGLPLGEGKTRSHLAAEMAYDFTPNTRAGLNGEVTSDDTYLNQFFDRTDPYLASTAFIEDGREQSYIGASMTHFRDLNPATSPASTAQVLPHIQMQKWWAFGPEGAQIEAAADVLALQRGLGTDTRRLATQVGYTLPTVLPEGSKLTFGATTRADFYTIGGAKNDLITRVMPELTAKWEKPYLSASGYHQVAPIAMLAVSPRGGNRSDKIPNEDSVAYELDTTNLFEPSRFAGLDRVETGPRFIYGLENRWGSADVTDYRLFLGQSIRRFDDATLPVTGGAATNSSDYVSEIEANPRDWLRSGARFRLDNANYVVRRMDASIGLGREETANFDATYSFLDDGAENLTAKAYTPLGQNWRLEGRLTQDLRESTLLEAESVLTWLRDCYAIEFIARRKGYRSTNLTPSTDYLVNIQLLTLGRSEGLGGLGMNRNSR